MFVELKWIKIQASKSRFSGYQAIEKPASASQNKTEMYWLQYLSCPGIHVVLDLSGLKGLPSVIGFSFSLFPCALGSAVFCAGRLPTRGGKRDHPQLQMGIVLIASLLQKRTVSAGSFVQVSVLTLCLSAAGPGWPHCPWTFTLYRGGVYSGQTWVRDSPPVVSSSQIICPKNGEWWVLRKVPAGDHHLREMSKNKEW